MPVETLNFLIPQSERATGTKDNRIVNGVIDVTLNALAQNIDGKLRKRKGLAQHLYPPAGAAVGRGIYYWPATGKVYSVFGSVIYSNGSSIKTGLATSTGRVWFTETPASASEQSLIISDGTDSYHISTIDGVTTVDENTDADYPTGNLGPVVYFDNYVFYFKSNGQMWNSDLNNFDSFAVDAYATASAKGDTLECGVQQRARIACLGKGSIEFYFDEGNASGSPMSRVDRSRLEIGCAAKETVAQIGSVCLFVGTQSDDGLRMVFLMREESVEDVSPPWLNRILDAETSSISSATAWCANIAGQAAYVLNLSSADRTFVYFIDSKIWIEWAAPGGGKFAGAYATMGPGTLYVQDATNGRIYTFSASGQDNGSSFTFEIQFAERDQGNQNRKSYTDAELDADTQSSGTASLDYSSDNFTTWTTIASTFDLTVNRKQIWRLGSAKGRLAWRLQQSGANEFGGMAVRVNYKMHKH